MTDASSTLGARARQALSLGKILANAGFLARGGNGAADAGDDDAEVQNPASAENASGYRTRFDRDEAVPLRDRLLAWWHGDILTLRAAAARKQSQVDDVPEVDLTQWSRERLKLVQEIWGESFLEPGGAVAARKLVTHVMPNSKQSVLDLTVGLGGTALTLAQDQGLWMDAREPDPALAAEAGRRAAMAGLSNQVSIEALDPQAPELPLGKYHLIYSRERLFTLHDKLPLLEAAAKALKQGGSLIITDLMVPDAGVIETDAFRDWGVSEPNPPEPWTVGLYAKTFEQLGLQITSRQNMTDEYLREIHAGWTRVSSELAAGSFDRRLEHWLLAEGAVWSARTKALSEGTLVLCRLIARRPD